MYFVHFSLVGISVLGVSFGTINSPSVKTSPWQIAQKHDGRINQGGQVLEVGAHHLGFVTEVSADKTHLDFYLQYGSNHQPIPNAKVTAQVQLPNGTKKSIAMTYDAKGKHYAAILPGKTVGLYKVTILCDINGKKVNGRFSFKR